MKNETPHFGTLLKELRLKKKLSQEKLAESVGVERNYIYYLEKGRSEPTLHVLMGLAQGLGMSFCELASKIEEYFQKANNS